MQTALVMTVIGKDKPGLVDSLAALVAEHGGNWLESRMSHLGGQFAGILRIQVPADRKASLIEALNELAPQGLTTVVHADEESASAPGERLALLEIVGHDRPGIVRQVSRVLAGRAVNVEELTTECVSAPMSGEMLFKARAKLQLSHACPLEALRRDLEKIAADLFVELSLAEL
jgi:glycine cleavage system regulatory protein